MQGNIWIALGILTVVTLILGVPYLEDRYLPEEFREKPEPQQPAATEEDSLKQAA